MLEIVGAVLVLQDVTAHVAIEADLEQQIIHLVSLSVKREEQSLAQPG